MGGWYSKVTKPVTDTLDRWSGQKHAEEDAKTAAESPAMAAVARSASENGPDFGGNGTKLSAPELKSVLDSRGNLASQYQMNTPGAVMSRDVTAGTLNSGGNLGTTKVSMASIMPDAQKRFDNAKVDDRGLSALRDRALEQGPSAWANLQHQRQQMAQQNALQDQAHSDSGAMANAMSQVAMRGGLSSGSAMRAARQAAQDSALNAQRIRRGGMGDSLGIDVADEQNKMDLLKQLPAADLARAGFDVDKAKALTAVQSDEQARNLQNDQFNSGQTFDASKFNILNNQDVQKANIANKLTADTTNAANTLDAAKTNTANMMTADQFNKSGGIAGVNQNNTNDLQKWTTNMTAWGANKTADAIQNGSSGKK